MWCAPSAVVAYAVLLAPARVSSRPSASRKVSPKPPSASSRRVSGPLVSSVTAPSRRTSPTAASAASAKSGPGSRFPA